MKLYWSLFLLRGRYGLQAGRKELAALLSADAAFGQVLLQAALFPGKDGEEMPGKGLVVGVEANAAAPGGVALRALEEFHGRVWRPTGLWLVPASAGSGIGDGKRLWSALVQPRFGGVSWGHTPRYGPVPVCRGTVPWFSGRDNGGWWVHSRAGGIDCRFRAGEPAFGRAAAPGVRGSDGLPAFAGLSPVAAGGGVEPVDGLSAVIEVHPRVGGVQLWWGWVA